MATVEVTVSFRSLARDLNIPEARIQAVVELLDAGNTIPFITRYRKDQTGGLDEEQIRTIATRVKKLRQLAERKQTILRAIESQNKLTPELAKKIIAANSLRRLEDLYLPFRPKKRTLATVARERGLGHLAEEILTADPICADLDKRAADYVDPEKKVLNIADALLGAGHILAEMFSEKTELRGRLRDILMRTGVIRTVRVVPEAEQAPVQTAAAAPAGAASAPTDQKTGEGGEASAAGSQGEGTETSSPQETTGTAEAIEPAVPAEQTSGEEAVATAAETTGVPSEINPAEKTSESPTTAEAVADPSALGQTEGGSATEILTPAQPAPDVAATPEESQGEKSVPAGEAAANPEQGETSREVAASSDGVPSAAAPQVVAASGGSAEAPAASSPAPAATPVDPKKAAKEAEKRRKLEKLAKEFEDYFDFSEPIRKIPPHRVLAINRGEALKVLRVRIEADMEAMEKAVEEICIPPGHPHADFLRGCAKDALVRLILPSLEREIRRELTERAENHAVKVFAQNLRRLLLQRPVRDRRILAIDPGYRQGCKLAALDECGNVLDHGVIYLIEKKGHSRETAKKTVIEMIEKHQLTAIAIGNGSGSRMTEMFIADLLENELKGRGIGYTIVNEAGASVYSTSQIGREELPHLDAIFRGAVSIGRRLLDPLSELVKIEPANLGVGLYQHDLKEKHLRESLDEVVESCVNYVGVDVNTASPALLGYVSGLNKLTARRIVEYRQQHGPFKTREELKKVPGIGETTFVQAAGFLKITGGENPLDATWIHPESYELAKQVLEKLGFTPDDLTQPVRKAELAIKIAEVNAEQLAAELGCGVLLLKDILAQFVRPGRDPREDLPPPVFKQGIVKLEDLSPGMELMGTVVNVVDFGAFVDVGLPNTGLIHRSRMKPFARSVDPHSVVAVGDVVRVWVVDVERERRRISLSLVPLEQMAERQTGDGRPSRKKKAAERRKAAKPVAAAQQREKETEVGTSERTVGRRRADRSERPGRKESPAPQHGPAPLTISRPVELPRRLGKPETPPPAEPLSEEVLSGKQPMRSFADLFQYFAAKGVVRPSTPSAKPSREKRGGGKKKPSARNGESPSMPEESGSPRVEDDQEKSGSSAEKTAPCLEEEVVARPPEAHLASTEEPERATSHDDRAANDESEKEKINPSPTANGNDPAQTDSPVESP